MPLYGPAWGSLRKHVAPRRRVSPWALITTEPVRVRPVFARFDLWIGIYIDRKTPAIYFFPLPMLGLRLDWPAANKGDD